jgi:hypothetical protein
MFFPNKKKYPEVFQQCLMYVNRLVAMGLKKGAPDMFLAYMGKTYYLELKQPGEKPRPSQIKIHSALRDQASEVYIIKTLETFKIIINSIINMEYPKDRLDAMEAHEIKMFGLSQKEHEQQSKIFDWFYKMELDEDWTWEEFGENQELYKKCVIKFVGLNYDLVNGFKLHYDLEGFRKKYFNYDEAKIKKVDLVKEAFNGKIIKYEKEE